MTTEPTSLRLDTDIKAKAFAVFEQIGIKPAQAFNLFLKQVVLCEGLPFSVKIPNAETLAAIDELARGEGTRYKNSKEMFKDLGI